MHIAAIRELAITQNEEVTLQNKILEPLQDNIDKIHENVITVNERLKDTLSQARDSSKICIDLACIMLLIGLTIVLYQLVQLCV